MSKDLKNVFELLISTLTMKGAELEVAELIYDKGLSLTRLEIQDVIKKHDLKNIEALKDTSLKLILSYIKFSLRDNYLTKLEKNNIAFLKLLLKINDGDFTSAPEIKDQVSEIIRIQLSLIYIDDNKIDDQEALHKVDLQEIFGLSYDEFLKFTNYEDSLAIKRGADKKNLDTVFFTKQESDSERSRVISQEVKDKVWNRDNGQCVQCSSNEDLEFDHIIPWSKGGANTYRNIQLLCESCNRIKSDSIGLDDEPSDNYDYFKDESLDEDI